MTKDRAGANGHGMSRRSLLTSIPFAGLAGGLPSVGKAHEPTAVLAVLNELESWQGWESSAVVCTKAFAAYRLRQALNLDLPDPSYARDHLVFQRETWDRCRRTIWFEQDQLQGKIYSAPILPGTI